MRLRTFAMSGVYSVLAALTFGALGCSTTPVLVSVRSMERPQDVDFICLEQLDEVTFRGVSIEKCAVLDDDSVAIADKNYRLHAVVTQVSRGELAVVDLGRGPRDTAGLVKVDPRLPGFNFLPVGNVPTDVATDPNGKAIYVASGRDKRVDVIPAELIRGPLASGAADDETLPWPKLDLDPAKDGPPAGLAVDRDRKDGGGRLYVSLPDAKDGPKIAVFDIGTSSLVPPRVGDLRIATDPPSVLPTAPAKCVYSSEPWWLAYESCSTPALPAGVTPPGNPPSKAFHLAQMTIAGGKMYVGDDAAPVVHVFDLETDTANEVARFGIGAKAARLAVSPPVPDEVTWANKADIETCELNGWMGDGKVHAGLTQLGDRCRQHRYLYAVDLANYEGGDGSLIVVDIPITYKAGADGTIGRDAKGRPLQELPDLFGGVLQQPFACDSPRLAYNRIPLGSFALGGGNAVPAKDVTFIAYDPPSPTGALRNMRCRGDLSTEATGRAGAQASWASGVDVRRLRGVFAAVVLANGSLVFIDVDDYDSLCRGPRTTVANPQFSLAEPARGANATDEVYGSGVRRHHPRANRLYTSDVGPQPSTPTFSQGATTLTVGDPSLPRLVPVVAPGKAVGPSGAAVETVQPSTDNPWGLGTEAWSITYEGELPGFGGNAATLINEGARITLQDPGGRFCRKGVEAFASSPADRRDQVQIVDNVCPGDVPGCNKDVCTAKFGAADAIPLSGNRDIPILEALDDRLVLDLNPTKLGELKACFPTLLKYSIRSRNSWLVLGSSSGLLHRVRPIDYGKTDSACTFDLTKPSIYTSRTLEIGATADPTKNLCVGFSNPFWRFAIRSGSARSSRDMRFSFTGRYDFAPLNVSVGSLLTSVQTISALRQGVDVLNWRQLAMIDAIDKGLAILSINDLTFARVIN